MTSTLDALTTLYRFLILVSATVLAIAAYYEPNPYPFTEAAETVKRVTTAYLEFVGEVRANATAKYRLQILPLVADRPSEQAIVKKAQFLPYSVAIADESTRIEQLSPIGDPEISLNWVLFMSTPNMSSQPRGTYPIFNLDREQLRDILQKIVEDPDSRSFYSTNDFVVHLIPPQPGTEAYCGLYFRSPQWEKANLPLYKRIKCTKQTITQDISELLQGFRNTAWQSGYSPPWLGGIPKLTNLPFPLAQSKIDALAKKETENEKVELLGPKLTIGGVLNIGPMLIIAILLLMLVHTRTIFLLPENEPADGAAWFGLFLRWLPLLTAIAVLVVLPTIATMTALAAGYEQPFDLPRTLDWWEPRLLWSQRWFIGGTLLVASISIWLVAANFRAARAWLARLAAAKAASWEV